MLYVKDDSRPVYVASTQAEYADAFVRALDLLYTCNGRKQTYMHDIAAAFEYGKHVFPINVLRAISTTGGPPARDAEGNVQDAVAEMERRVHMVGQDFGLVSSDVSLDALLSRVTRTTLSLCQGILEPSIGIPLEVTDDDILAAIMS